MTAPVAPPAEGRTLTDVAADAIRTRIVLGHLAPGSKLRVDALAAELSVSRVPVREAFRELLAEGLVETFPMRGAVVAGIRREDVDDGYRMLETVEVMAAERVVATGAAPALADRMRPHLAHLSTDLSPLDLLTTHRAFHFEVFAALGDGVLRRTAHTLWHTCERYIIASAQGPRLHEAHKEHTDLVHYLSASDVTGAVAMTRMHVAHGREAALRAFEP